MGRERLGCDGAPRTSADPLWGSLRAEIAFRVVPRWVGRPGLSPGLGQSLGVGFLWKEEEP